jgi:hypothetical protein
LFPLITPGLYSKIGTEWGSSIFAFLALLCMPLPFLFYVSTILLVCSSSFSSRSHGQKQQ